MDKEKIVETINRVLKTNLDPATTPADVTFKGLGIDSLDFYNVLIDLENTTGRHIPDADADKLTTINSLVDYFS